MSCLVTGATGNVGSLVTERLLDRGERPAVFVRDRKKAQRLFGDRVEIRVGDLADLSGALDQWVSENAQAFTISHTTRGR